MKQCNNRTRRERLKSTPYLRLKKLKLFEIVKGGTLLKKTKNRKVGILSKSQSVEKLERGDPLDFLKLQFAVKYQKRGTLWRQKNFQKKSHSAEKNSNGGPFALS